MGGEEGGRLWEQSTSRQEPPADQVRAQRPAHMQMQVCFLGTMAVPDGALSIGKGQSAGQVTEREEVGEGSEVWTSVV